MIFSACGICSPVKPSCERQFAGLERLEAALRRDRLLDDRVGSAGGHFLDLDAPFGAHHQDRHADGPVEDHADVDFPGDVGRFLHQHLGNLLALFVGLLGDERKPEHDVGDLGHLVTRT